MAKTVPGTASIYNLFHGRIRIIIIRVNYETGTGQQVTHLHDRYMMMMMMMMWMMQKH